MTTELSRQLPDFVANKKSPSFRDEPDLAVRLTNLHRQFRAAYGVDPQVHVRSPGRAEILGNHTDYNNGYALAAAISRSTLVFMAKRQDGMIRARSNAYPDTEVVFKLNALTRDAELYWGNYLRGVVREIMGGGEIGGADIMIDSNVPNSGGVSSSAALEIGVARGLHRLYGIEAGELETAMLCRRAENGEFVGSPCGLLDQATVAFSESGRMVLLDFQPRAGGPISVKMVNADLADKGLSFVIAVDPGVRRNLGDSGYPVRRRMCEESVPILAGLLGRKLASLRDVSIADFQKCGRELEKKGGRLMRMRVEHVVHENQRVLDGVGALERGDFALFGGIMTQSGRSALELYELDAETPELTCLVNEARSLSGVAGTRNMGGGFSAITLSLVQKSEIADFTRELERSYRSQFGRPLHFIEFRATQGAEIL